MGQLPTYYDEKFPLFPHANQLILLVEKSPFFGVLREGVFSAFSRIKTLREQNTPCTSHLWKRSC
jgi:uncharacterized membrane protein YiaA